MDWRLHPVELPEGDSGVSTEIAELARQCRAVLQVKPAGLLTDIDGTISLIAPTPDAASVSDEARDALRRLTDCLEVVGAVTGRAAENAESMVSVPKLVYIGNHGLERRVAGVTHVNPAAAIASDAIAASMSDVRIAGEALGIVDGIIYENKGVTGSVHYRLAPDQDGARDALLPLLREAADVRGLKVTEGRMVIELRPSLAINKGSAVVSVVEQSELRSLVFLGDDVTDVDAFRALSRLRDEGRIHGLNIAIVAPESNPEVAKAADACIQGVESCVQLLTALADSFEMKGENA